VGTNNPPVKGKKHMCGKFTQRKIPQQSWRDYRDLLDLIGKPDAAEAVTPMRFAAILRADATGGVETVSMRWGFPALSAQNPSKPDHIHARAETIDEKPTFRDAFRERRGLLLVETFNEGEELSPTRTFQHVVTPNDGKPLAIAVLWEAWHHAEQGELLTFVMATTPANALIASITDRMPAVLEQKDWPAWLGLVPATPAELKAMLKPHDGAAWTMAPEKKQPPPKKPKANAMQGELF
jgi:putative SOS response-associated peptidase YedK